SLPSGSEENDPTGSVRVSMIRDPSGSENLEVGDLFVPCSRGGAQVEMNPILPLFWLGDFDEQAIDGPPGKQSCIQRRRDRSVLRMRCCSRVPPSTIRRARTHSRSRRAVCEMYAVIAS